MTVQPLLRRIKSGTKRMQHNWHTHFAVDYVHKQTVSYVGTGHQALPNDTAQAGVVSKGYLQMTVNKWYNWGDAWTTEVPNDGKVHYFGVRMECIGTNPKSCPKSGYLYAPLQTAVYTAPNTDVPAPKPTGLYTTFNPSTRELQYYWDNADCAYKKLYRRQFDIDGNIVQTGWVSPNTDGKLYDKNKPYREVLPENVASVIYRMVNVSSTGAEKNSGNYDAMWNIPNTPNTSTRFPSNHRVWIKVNGTWKKAIPWVKVDGVWKMVMHTYARDEDAWKRVTM